VGYALRHAGNRPVCGFVYCIPCFAQSSLSDQWGHLLDEKKYAQADKLCTSWSHSGKVGTQVEAQKCLANLALSKGQQISLMGNDQGGGTLGEGYTPEAVDESLKHLNEGIRLAPQDLSIHQGRLHVLEVSGRFDAMAVALDESASTITGTDVLQDWLPYTAELANMGQLTAGLKLCMILDRHYPNSHDVIGNIGAFYNMMKQTDKSLPYLKEAVELAPNDAIDTWNLGRAYDFLDKNDLAEQWYSKAISIDPAGKGLEGRNCLYGEFVERTLHDEERACKLERASCGVERQTACASTAKSATPEAPPKQ